MMKNLTVRDEDNIIYRRKNKKIMEPKNISNQIKEKNIENKDSVNNKSITVENNLNRKF